MNQNRVFRILCGTLFMLELGSLFIFLCAVLQGNIGLFWGLFLAGASFVATNLLINLLMYCIDLCAPTCRRQPRQATSHRAFHSVPSLGTAVKSQRAA